MILALARPPRATFGCLHAPPGALRGWVPKKSADPAPTVQEIIDHRCEACRRRTDRGLRRYSPPPRAPSHASLHPFGPCPHLVIRSVVPLPSFAHAAGRALVRSSAHSNTRPSAHRSFARTLALSYVARLVRSSPARFSCLVSFLLSLARSLWYQCVRSLARSLARSFARSFAHS